MSTVARGIENIVLALHAMLQVLDRSEVREMRAIQQSAAGECQWHSIHECVPPEGVDVLLFDWGNSCSRHPYGIVQRSGNGYVSVEMDETGLPAERLRWMHIPPDE